MDKTEVLRKAVEYSKRVQKYLSFKKVVLFGSYANGNPREDSDFDLAFFVDKLDEGTDYLTLLTALYKSARQIDSRIEPHIIFNENDEAGFGNFIIKNGQQIILVN